MSCPRRQCLPLLTLLMVTLSFPASAIPAREPPSAAEAPPAGWTLETDAPAGAPAVAVDGGIRISHAESASTTLTSEPVRLRVGHLYRLGGWIRTEGVRSDALSRYPTAVGACLTMASFPFTNHSPTVGGSGDRRRVEVLFIATRAEDRMRMHL
ncbi:MAG: hypothetical protein GY856_52890, partial [bacterium]|nr:hypothetical protein [bacterium]